MRRPVQQRDEEPGGELNVVPYLDILMNLILFMLLSMTGLATLGAAEAEGPRSPAPGTSVAARLSVSIERAGFVIERDGQAPVRIASHDFQTLTSTLAGLKPGPQRIELRAEPGVDYATIVATLDAARETTDRQPLFPDVTLVY